MLGWMAGEKLESTSVVSPAKSVAWICPETLSSERVVGDCDLTWFKININ